MLVAWLGNNNTPYRTIEIEFI